MDPIIALERKVKELRAYTIIPTDKVDTMLAAIEEVKAELNNKKFHTYKMLSVEEECPNCRTRHYKTMYQGFCSIKCFNSF